MSRFKHKCDCKCTECNETRNAIQRERRAKLKAQEQREKEIYMIGKPVKHRVVVRHRTEEL